MEATRPAGDRRGAPGSVLRLDLPPPSSDAPFIITISPSIEQRRSSFGLSIAAYAHQTFLVLTSNSHNNAHATYVSHITLSPNLHLTHRGSTPHLYHSYPQHNTYHYILPPPSRS